MLRETELDRVNEDAVAQRVAEAWSCDVDKLRETSRVDRLCSRLGDGGVRQYYCSIEIKCRRHKAGEYPTWMIAQSKVAALQGLARDLAMPSFFVVRWSNVIGWFNIDDFTECKIGGRYDQPDEPTSIEMMCHYPVRSAKHLVVPPQVFENTGK